MFSPFFIVGAFILCFNIVYIFLAEKLRFKALSEPGFILLQPITNMIAPT